jgi:RNA polymerase sigma factor (sigma-70 family)
VDGEDALLTAWRGGDMSAGRELYRRYFPIVYRFFSNKLGEDIEDLVQCTFLACASHRERLRENASFRAFVLVVARNEFFSHLQRRYRLGNSVELSTVSLEDLGSTPSQMIARRDEHRLLLLALRRIPIELQELVELHYFEQLTGPELVTVLGVPEGTVRSRLRRAITSLRNELERMASSPAQVESTIGSLTGWAAEIRALSEHTLAELG